MKTDEAMMAFGSGKRRVRPSDWLHRLMGLAAAHWVDEAGPQPCETCGACSDTTCFVFPASLRDTHPGLVRDLLFCLGMLEVPEVSVRCPRSRPSAFEQKSAA